MIITDGTGSQRGVAVDTENRIHTFSTIEPEDKHKNKTFGIVWSAYVPSVTPVGAGDYFFYYKNTGTDDVFISDIRISSTVATQINYHKVSGTPSYVSSTAITPTTRNFGSNKTLEGDLYYDTNITGISSDGVLFFEKCATADTIYHLRTTSNIIIAPGTAFAIERVAATGAITCVVSFIGSE